MTTSTVKSPHALARPIRFDEHMMHVLLLDGRELSVPIEWFPTLRNASKARRNNWRLIGNGIGIHWPDLREDISSAALLEQ